MHPNDLKDINEWLQDKIGTVEDGDTNDTITQHLAEREKEMWGDLVKDKPIEHFKKGLVFKQFLMPKDEVKN